MPNETGETIGMWIGPEHADLLADFDALDGSRSANLRRAMALLVAVDGVMATNGESPADHDARKFRAMVRQGMVEYYRESE